MHYSLLGAGADDADPAAGAACRIGIRFRCPAPCADLTPGRTLTPPGRA